MLTDILASFSLKYRKHTPRLYGRPGYTGPAERIGETHAGGQSGAEAAAAAEAGGVDEGGDFG